MLDGTNPCVLPPLEIKVNGIKGVGGVAYMEAYVDQTTDIFS
jgi:hypothetical protein